MTNFEKITETPEALGELLASLTVIDSPWEDAFHKAFCADCERGGGVRHGALPPPERAEQSDVVDDAGGGG